LGIGDWAQSPIPIKCFLKNKKAHQYIYNVYFKFNFCLNNKDF